jgi:hypothetical protein
VATESQLTYSRDYKRFERATNPKFREKEKAYRNKHNRKRYAEFKIALAFVESFPEAFCMWMEQGMGGRVPVAPPRSYSTPIQTMPPIIKNEQQR